MVQQLLFTSLILSSIQTFGSYAAADVKGAAADIAACGSEVAGKVTAAHYDGEIDTSASYYTYEPPLAEALKEAYEKASKQKHQLDVLVELCKPYDRCNPDLYAAEVFERWKKLCEELKLLVKGRFTYTAYFVAHAKRYSELLNEVGACCLGIAARGLAGLTAVIDADDIPIPRVKHFYNHYYMFHEYFRTHAHLIFARRPSLYAEKVREVTPLLQPLARFVGEYANEFGFLLAESLQLMWPLDTENSIFEVGFLYDGTYRMSSRMLASLEGALPSDYAAQSRIDFSYNLISNFASYNFPRCCKELSLSNNRLYRLPSDAFIHQSALQTLRLSFNFLKQVARASFSGLINLRELHLDNNNISVIEEGALTQLPKLIKICLNNNALQRIPLDVEALVNQGQLTSLNLWENPIENDSEQKIKRDVLMARVQHNEGEQNKCSLQ